MEFDPHEVPKMTESSIVPQFFIFILGLVSVLQSHGATFTILEFLIYAISKNDDQLLELKRAVTLDEECLLHLS